MNGLEALDYRSQGLLHRLHGWMLERRAAREANQERVAAIAEAIEEVVSGTEPRLRALSGYDRLLWPVVYRTLGYVTGLIARLPPPIELSRVAWQWDPHVNAFFASASDLPLVLSRTRELQDFFRRRPGATQAFAIMTSTRKEKQVFGISLQEDMVRRDVAQTSVGFLEPLLLGPSATESEVREEARRCALKLFIGLARERVSKFQGRREGLERERQIQEARLRSLRARARNQAPNAEVQVKIAAAERSLAENADELKALGGPRIRLEAVLEEVRAVLAAPEDQLILAPASLRVDRLGIKQESGTATPANDLSLLECTTASSRRVITLVRCPREEMLTMDQIAERMDPYLASQLGMRGD